MPVKSFTRFAYEARTTFIVQPTSVMFSWVSQLRVPFADARGDAPEERVLAFRAHAADHVPVVHHRDHLRDVRRIVLEVRVHGRDQLAARG